MGIIIESGWLKSKVRPDYGEAHYNLGIAYMGVGKKQAALEQFKILKNLDRDFADKLFNLIYK